MPDFTIITNISGCSRCGFYHDDVKFTRLTHPIEDTDGQWTHWAPCPNNKEPIILRTVVTLT